MVVVNPTLCFVNHSEISPSSTVKLVTVGLRYTRLASNTTQLSSAFCSITARRSTQRMIRSVHDMILIFVGKYQSRGWWKDGLLLNLNSVFLIIDALGSFGRRDDTSTFPSIQDQTAVFYVFHGVPSAGRRMIDCLRLLLKVS